MAPPQRPPRTGSSCSLEWSFEVSHLNLTHLKARLETSLGRPKGGKLGLRSLVCGKCSIEVWVEGKVAGLAQSRSASSLSPLNRLKPQELAYCRVLVSAHNPCARVLWLGRSDSRPVHSTVSGIRSVEVAEEARRVTLAEAVLGIASALCGRIGASSLDCQVMDTGSGKLVQLYLDLGFRKVRQLQGEILWMEAPMEALARLAPASWLEGLVPADFEGQHWLRFSTARLALRMSAGTSKTSSWAVAWPEGAQLEARVLPQGHALGPEEPGATLIEVWLNDAYGRELAFVQGQASRTQGLLQVIWLGRSGWRSVHAGVRGKPSYAVRGGPVEQKVTASIGLLGALATVGHWFGAVTVELQLVQGHETGPSSDDGSGNGGFDRLVSYLRGIGLQEAPVQAEAAEQAPHFSGACEALARRCCPLEWAAELPPLELLPVPEAPAEDAAPKAEPPGPDIVEQDQAVAVVEGVDASTASPRPRLQIGGSDAAATAAFLPPERTMDAAKAAERRRQWQREMRKIAAEEALNICALVR
mmetsp:Transcript_67660/g.151973  ORF Transcript_67660/g.151973 Transcript_67660/m.151973 type:complete len:530 (+) Transcript_67660:65-1654(+)